jgi:DNA repair protein RadD
MNADRAYQLRAKSGARECYRGGARSVLLVAPTGSGKTVMCADMVRDHLAKDPRNRVAWYAHRRELEGQAADTLRRMGLGVSHRGLGLGSRVQVLSVQGAIARGEIPDTTMSVFDEAHHFASDEWQTLVRAARTRGFILGATATPERGDGRGLHEMFDALVVAAQPKELIDAGHLVPAEVVRPRRPLHPDEIARTPVDAYLERCPDMRVVVYAPHRLAMREYAAGFVARGVACETIDGETPTPERDARLARFRDGSTKVICNVNVLTEGYDCPELDGVIIARGCGTHGLWIQIVGRALRSSPGKTFGLVLDLRGVSHEYGMPDADREYSLDGLAIRVRGPDASFCPACGAVLARDGPCPSCVRQAESTQETPHATGDELERFAAKRAEGMSARISTLVRWLIAGRAKGWKDRASHHRYRAVYGEWPSVAVRAQAEAAVAAVVPVSADATMRGGV